MTSSALRAFWRKGRKALWMCLIRPRGFTDYCLSTLSSLLRLQRIWGRPVFITIEPTTTCDLRCPVCETGAGILNRDRGQMSLEHFQRLVDQISSHTNAIQLYFMGEPFLNRRIYDMICYAKAQGIFVNTYSDGSFFDVRKVIESGLDEINFNIGGMAQETHQIYRVNSKLADVINNIRTLAVERAKWVSDSRGRKRRPRISVGFIVMKHNEHEVEKFLETVPTWGVDRVHVVDPCVRDMDQAKTFLPTNLKHWCYDEQAFSRGILQPKVIPNNSCPWIYYSTVITWNGNVLPCCRDATGQHTMGNVFKGDLAQIWNGPKYREFRRTIKANQKALDICRLCSSFPVPALYEAEPSSCE